MKIRSTAFEHNQRIPKKYTGEGEDVSPPLAFEEIPNGTVSLALIVDDPDAPMGTFDHWVTWNLTPEQGGIPEGGNVSIQGMNHFKKLAYGGPLPPPGPVHRYFFKLYALDADLNLPEGATKGEVEAAMEGHIIDKAILVGTYQR